MERPPRHMSGRSTRKAHSLQVLTQTDPIGLEEADASAEGTNPIFASRGTSPRQSNRTFLLGVDNQTVVVAKNGLEPPGPSAATSGEPRPVAAIVRLTGTYCTRTCARHADCPSSDFCSGCTFDGTCDGVCLPGCRSSTQCIEAEWCNGGVCAVLCHEDDECLVGRTASLCLGGPNGACRATCSTDLDCAKSVSKHCTCGVCTTACNVASDCDPGSSCVPLTGCSTTLCTFPVSTARRATTMTSRGGPSAQGWKRIAPASPTAHRSADAPPQMAMSLRPAPVSTSDHAPPFQWYTRPKPVP